jgi:hypothetical protein
MITWTKSKGERSSGNEASPRTNKDIKITTSCINPFKKVKGELKEIHLKKSLTQNINTMSTTATNKHRKRCTKQAMLLNVSI